MPHSALGTTETTPLFRPLLLELTGLLRALNAADWDRPTLAGSWKVKDVAGHLLDGQLRRLAAGRDHHFVAPDPPIASSRDLTRFINSLNASGVAFAARLSGRLITDLLEVVGGEVAELMAALDPLEPALWPVSWAGEGASANWMDIGREYTEQWHHQAQIRDAVGEPRLLVPRWMTPLIDLSVRSLPVAYAAIDAPEGTSVALEVHGPTSGVWSVVRHDASWQVFRGRADSPAAVVQAGADDVWRIFYNAIQSPGLMDRVKIDGDHRLAQAMIEARSVIV